MLWLRSHQSAGRGRGAGSLGLAALLALAGCGKNPSSDSTPSSKTARPSAKAAAKKPSPETTNSVPKAVFIDDPKVGRDPFFPNSSRRGAQEAGSVVSVASLAQELVLRAIFQTNPPRAWINNRSFEPGEQGELKLPDGKKITLRCVEISARSVVVEISGIPGRQTLTLEGVR